MLHAFICAGLHVHAMSNSASYNPSSGTLSSFASLCQLQALGTQKTDRDKYEKDLLRMIGQCSSMHSALGLVNFSGDVRKALEECGTQLAGVRTKLWEIKDDSDLVIFQDAFKEVEKTAGEFKAVEKAANDLLRKKPPIKEPKV